MTQTHLQPSPLPQILLPDMAMAIVLPHQVTLSREVSPTCQTTALQSVVFGQTQHLLIVLTLMRALASGTGPTALSTKRWGPPLEMQNGQIMELGQHQERTQHMHQLQMLSQRIKAQRRCMQCFHLHRIYRMQTWQVNYSSSALRPFAIMTGNWR